MNGQPNILICDDDPVVHESLALYLILTMITSPTLMHMTADRVLRWLRPAMPILYFSMS